MKNSLKSYVFNLTLIILITGVTLWFALKDQYQEVMMLIGQMPWYWIVIILSWGLIYAVLVGCILTVFAKRNNKNYKYRQGIATGLVGMFFSGITPSATGGQFAQAYVFNKQGVKISEAASILWADFIVYQTTMMLYVTVLFIARFHYFMDMVGPWFWAIFVGYLVNIVVIAVLWTVALFPKLYVFLSGKLVSLLAKLRIVKNKERTLQEWTLQVESFIREIKLMHHDKKLIIKTVSLNIIRMTVQFMLPFYIMRAMGVDVGMNRFVDCLALSSFVLMANAFIPIPGASGGTELIFTALFISIVHSSILSSGVMILWRFSTYHFVMIAGAITFILVKRKYDKQRWKKEEGSLCE